VLLAAVVIAMGTVGVSAPAGAAITWAPAATAAIHPGVQTFTPLPDGGEGQCTANFVFSDGTDVYLGLAAHCAGLGGATDTDGCLADTLPVGSPIDVDGASKPGHIAYSSWATMHDVGETDADTCAYNDLLLIKLDPADYGKVNPSVPTWGGPVGLGSSTDALDKVYSYGNSSLRFGLTQTSPKEGYSLGTAGWTTDVYTVSPGIPGDSGSGFLDSQGRAFGVLSTVAFTPLPLSNGIGSLAMELAYMYAHTFLGAVTLVPGTQPFKPGLLP
jgi:hypothetical protein